MSNEKITVLEHGGEMWVRVDAVHPLRDQITALESKLQACEKELKDKHEAYEIAVTQAMENGARANGCESRLEVVSKEVEAMEALLEKATNDVSAWKSRATSAESRIEGMQLMLDSWREAYRKLTAGDHAEVRLDTDGAIDEVVGSGVFQMEQMDTNRWFFDLAGCKFNIDGKKVTLTPIEVDTWAEEQKRIAVETQKRESGPASGYPEDFDRKWE